MFRLVIVAGPNRGSSFNLIEGENSIGRQVDNHIVLTSSKISKRHCALLVTSNEVIFRDEGSTNGSFVNGAVCKKQTLKPGDKLSLGEFVLELVQAVQPQTVSHLQPMSAPMPASYGSGALAHHPIYRPAAAPAPIRHAQPQAQAYQPAPTPVIEAPDDLPGKIGFFFEGKVMPGFYGMLMNSEYRSIAAIIIGVFTAIAVVGSVMPMQDLAEQSTRMDALSKARILSREVADRFLPNIASHTESQIDLSLLEGEDSVKLVAITNPSLQIIAPQSRLNQLLAGGREAAYAMGMAKEFRDGREKGAGRVIDETTAVWVEPIKTNDPHQMKSQISAIAVVAVDFSNNVIASGGLGVAYGTGFVIAGIAAILAYFILLRLSLKPFEVLNDDLDQVLRGEIPRVTHEFKITELKSLWDNLNAAILRIPKSGMAASSGDDTQVNWDQEFAPVRALAEATSLGFIAFDSNLVVVAMNPQFDDVAGIRMDAIGQSLSQVARDQAFVLLITDLKDRVLGSPSQSAIDECEFNGINYQVIATGAGTTSQPGFAAVFRKKE